MVRTGDGPDVTLVWHGTPHGATYSTVRTGYLLGAAGRLSGVCVARDGDDLEGFGHRRVDVRQVDEVVVGGLEARRYVWYAVTDPRIRALVDLARIPSCPATQRRWRPQRRWHPAHTWPPRAGLGMFCASRESVGSVVN